MAEEENMEEENNKGSSKKIIILIALGIVILAVGAGGAMLFMSSNDPDEAETAEETVEEEMEKKMSIYHELHPAFVANFSGKSKKRYMQVYVVAMAYEDSVIEDLKMHMPAVRNDVLMTLSATKSEEVETVEGKEALRQKVLSKIKETMQEKTGGEGIEDIYFTKFVVQ